MINKVYIVEAFYEDKEGSSWLQIGLFTDKSVAESIKKKWENFHSMYKDILKEPENYDEYYKFKHKYEKFIEFDSIRIEEFNLDEDKFCKQVSYISSEDFTTLAKEYERDWKLNEILK